MRLLVIFLVIIIASCAPKPKAIYGTSVFSNKQLKTNVLKHLNKEELTPDDVLLKPFPDSPDESIALITEANYEILNEEVYDLNCHLLIINNKTGKITHQYYEDAEQTGWSTDAIFIDYIAIDTTAYPLQKSHQAFAILVHYRGSSQPNPYNETQLSLYTKTNKSLKKVVDNFTIYESVGEVNVNIDTCSAHFERIERQLSMSPEKTNSLNNILVTETKIHSNYQIDHTGDCNPKDSIVQIQTSMLKFNRKQYIQNREKLTIDE